MEFIYEEDNHVPKEICDELIKQFENNKDRQIQGGTVTGVNKNIKDSRDLPLHKIDDHEYLANKLNEYIRLAIDKYTEYIYENDIDMKRGLVKKKLGNIFIGPPQIQKTTPNGFYRWHHDGCGTRILTYIIYLNDVEEGCGGTTDFTCGKSVQPKAGKIVIFPAIWTYYHRGKKLENGVKYIATSFVWPSGPPYE